MAAHQEIYNFVNESMNLCKIGENANLSLQYNRSRAVVIKFIFAKLLLHLTIHTDHLAQAPVLHD